MMPITKTVATVGLSLAVHGALAIDLNVNNATSVRAAAKTVADSIINRYNNGTDIPGLFPSPYYFWESGLAWDSLINYQYLTGDTSYNELINDALTSQVGPDHDFMPPNQTKSEGNDDQAYWALAAMTATERGFPEPHDSNVTWVQLARNVFDEQVARWDNDTCNGGLRWQIFSFNNGYSYKNSMSNGAFFQLATRLGHYYTDNTTYLDWAQTSYEWAFQVGLIANSSDTENIAAVYDGTSVDGNCTQVNHIQWTASIAQYIAGTAYWWNSTSTLGSQGYITLFSRANLTFSSGGIANSTNGTITEVACAPNKNCNTDQLAFRAPLARALAQINALTPDTRLYQSSNTTLPNGQTMPQANLSEPLWTVHERVNFILQTSARGAAAQCSGGSNGTTCGSDWSNSTWDGTEGLGQDLSALNIILANLPAGPLANATVTRPGPAPGNSSAPNTTSEGNSTGASPAPAPVNTNIGTGLPAISFALMAGIGFAIAFGI